LQRINPASSGVLPIIGTARAILEAITFRISRCVSDEANDVAQVDEIEPTVRSTEPGRRHIDQIERDPLPSGRTSRQWGVAIMKRDSSVVI
jgi:hypothetical protein